MTSSGISFLGFVCLFMNLSSELCYCDLSNAYFHLNSSRTFRKIPRTNIIHIFKPNMNANILMLIGLCHSLRQLFSVKYLCHRIKIYLLHLMCNEQAYSGIMLHMYQYVMNQLAQDTEQGGYSSVFISTFNFVFLDYFSSLNLKGL